MRHPMTDTRPRCATCRAPYTPPGPNAGRRDTGTCEACREAELGAERSADLRAGDGRDRRTLPRIPGLED